MKSQIRKVQEGEHHYEALVFCCPGCKEIEARLWADGNPGDGLHVLPIRGNVPGGRPRWDFDGNLEAPTLSPSILTRLGPQGKEVCHSFLKGGVFQFLGDCTHSLANKHAPMPDLPDWAVKPAA